MINIVGLGGVLEDIVVLRQKGQSYTCREKRASLTVENDDESELAVVKLDGGLFPDGDACDYSVSLRYVEKGFILELKGRDMSHAVDQLGKTLKKLTFKYAKAVVVSSGAGKIPTGKWQKIQKAFFSRNHVPLGRLSNNGRERFLNVIA